MASEALGPGAGLELDSRLWLDQADHAARIEERLQSGEISAEQAEKLRFFAHHGYLTFALDVDPSRLDALVAGAERLWREKPADVAYASDSPARPLARADEASERHARYRFHDIHSHVRPALELYLNPQIFSYVKLILGEDALAIQSLFFEYGSEQVLHRDPVVVPTGAPGHLLAAWIALEDISPDCGALVYIPGSHRLPYYEFAPGEYEFDAQTMGAEEIAAATAFDDAQARRYGLEPKLFTAKKGEVLIWHASLRHGGAPVRDPALTRKSFVVHYTTRATYPSRSITVFDAEPEEAGGGERPRVMETEVVLERRGCRGFDNPMRGFRRS